MCRVSVDGVVGGNTDSFFIVIGRNIVYTCRYINKFGGRGLILLGS